MGTDLYNLGLSPTDLLSGETTPVRNTRGNRPFATHMPLGKVMDARGVRVLDMAYRSKVSYRTMTEYLAGRKTPPVRHLVAMARVLRVPPAMIAPPDHPMRKAAQQRQSQDPQEQRTQEPQEPRTQEPHTSAAGE